MTTQTRDPADAPRRRTVAFVFPGQGSQYVGMGAALARSAHPPPRTPIGAPTRRLAFPCRKLILEGPAEELDLTVNAQPAILATSYRLPGGDARGGAARPASRLRRRRWPATRPASTPPPSPPMRSTSTMPSRLVRERGRIMQERGIEGGMGAVIGLSDEQVEEVVDAAREHGEIARRQPERAGPDRPLGRHPRPRVRPRDEQDGRRPQGGAPDGERRQPLPAHAPRARRVRPHPRQGALPRSAASRCSATSTPPSSRHADGLRSELTEHLVHGVQWTASDPPHGGRRRHRLRRGRPRAASSPA